MTKKFSIPDICITDSSSKLRQPALHQGLVGPGQPYPAGSCLQLPESSSRSITTVGDVAIRLFLAAAES